MLALPGVLPAALALQAQDLVRLGDLKFAHYGAVSYMKELAPKYNLKIEERKTAEKYVREMMFKNQISSEDYQDAIGNSPFTYDITVPHVQITTDLMAKYGVGKMANPPKAGDWVKLDLLTEAKKQLKVK